MRPIQTRFPYGSGILNLATERNSQDHSPKGTPSPRRALTACKHTISGSISLPSPGFFSPFPHGTIRYRLIRVFSLTRYGPRRFTQNSSCSVLLGRATRIFQFTCTGLSPSMVKLSSLF